MSDQTPNSTEDLNGSEPSMEDILASIRKIISEDEPVALESPEDSALEDIVSSEFGRAPTNFVSDAVADAQIESLTEAADVDTGSVDLNIDDVLSRMDDDLTSDETIELPDMASDKPHVSATESPQSLAGDFESDDDVLSFLDSEIPLEPELSGADASDNLSAVEDFVLPNSDLGPVSEFTPSSDIADAVDLDNVETKVTVEDNEMDSLLDEILMTPEDEVIDFAPDALDASGTDNIVNESEDTFASAEESDLNLVKSLMADLADDPDSFETEADLDALLEIPDLDASEEILEDQASFAETDFETAHANDESLAAPDALDVETAQTEAVEIEAVESDDDILGDILGMTLDDELESHPDDVDVAALASFDDVAAAEQDNIVENALELDAPESDTVEAADTLPSLSEIAAAAEADAVAVETGAIAAAGAAAAGAGLAALGAKAVDQNIEPEVDTSVELNVDAQSTKIESLAAEASATDAVTQTTPELPQSLSNQETSMPVKAVKTDTILDEVTETATAGAFAELNSVVEDKAIFNERGPRIGDLVQEALRPMLKEWLDANLKGIVERAVTKEVKRISKGQ